MLEPYLSSPISRQPCLARLLQTKSYTILQFFLKLPNYPLQRDLANSESILQCFQFQLQFKRQGAEFNLIVAGHCIERNQPVSRSDCVHYYDYSTSSAQLIS